MRIHILAALLLLSPVPPSFAAANSPANPAQNPSSEKPTPDHIVTKFVHPGILHTAADLERMKRKVAAGEEPWKSGFEILKNSKQARFDYKMRGPFDSAGRSADGHTKEITDDSHWISCSGAFPAAREV